MTDHEQYSSPFSWRYGTAEMRALWSEAERRRLMRLVWLALAEAQAGAGLVTDEQLDDLRSTVGAPDMERAAAIERTTKHDVMAEILAWAEKAPVGGAVLHLGATSADITENADALRIRTGLSILRARLVAVIDGLIGRVTEHADTVTIGWTHLQPAAPTTVGYRLAVHLEDFVADLEVLDWLLPRVRGKGFKGAVGTRASFAALLQGTGVSPADLDDAAMTRLGLPAVQVCGQVVPRKQEWLILGCLAGIAASAGTFAFNLRLLQSPVFGEWFEGFAEGQVGSSAMPWKRNPVEAENVSSLARFVASLPGVAWHNEEACLLERTLDDSANRRLILPEAFLAVDEILSRVARLIARLTVDEAAIERTVERFSPFAATELVLMRAARAGADRQSLHDCLRRHSLAAWSAVEAGEANPLAGLVARDPDVRGWLTDQEIAEIFEGRASHVGDAPDRARAAAQAAAGLIGA